MVLTLNWMLRVTNLPFCHLGKFDWVEISLKALPFYQQIKTREVLTENQWSYIKYNLLIRMQMSRNSYKRYKHSKLRSKIDKRYFINNLSKQLLCKLRIIKIEHKIPSRNFLIFSPHLQYYKVPDYTNIFKRNQKCYQCWFVTDSLPMICYQCYQWKSTFHMCRYYKRKSHAGKITIISKDKISALMIRNNSLPLNRMWSYLGLQRKGCSNLWIKEKSCLANIQV